MHTQIYLFILFYFVGSLHCPLYSSDSVDGDKAQLLYKPEFLASIDLPGLPPHRLDLKVGCPIMLLRNLNPHGGACNGTRLIVRNISKRLIVADIIGGEHKGKTIYIPRVRFLFYLLPFISYYVVLCRFHFVQPILPSDSCLLEDNFPFVWHSL